MGVVYEAEQVSLGRRVALKVLPSQVAGDGLALERFRREAKAAARLHHTNIVPVFEVGRDGEVAYYAMQFIEGQGLDKVIDELARLRDPGRKPGAAEGPGPTAAAAATGAREPALGRIAESLLTGRFATEGAVPSGEMPPDAPTGPAATERLARDATHASDFVLADPEPAGPGPTPAPGPSAVLPGGSQVSTVQLSGRRAPFFRSVAQIGRQAAQGLAYAHASGIVHRDIKPSNLLLDHAGVVWIADFGLAKGDDEGLTQSGDILGTLRYMAPERFRGEGDARADVYALGLTLYELLTLRPAFDDVRPAEADRADQERGAAAAPIASTAASRATWRRSCSRRSRRTPRRGTSRPRRWPRTSGGSSPTSRSRPARSSAAERYWRWARRNPVIAVLGGVLTAVLVATTVGSMVAASYFRSLAGSESRANQKSQEARASRPSSSATSLAQLSAGLTLDKGFALAQEGHADRGLLWMLEALKTAPDDAEEFRRTVRWNLGAWLGQVHKPLRIIDTAVPAITSPSAPTGASFATSFNRPADRSNATPIDLWETASGRKLSTFPACSARSPSARTAIPRRQRGQREAHGGRRPGHGAGTLDDPGLTRRAGGEGLDFSPDGSTLLGPRSPRWQVRREDGAYCDWTS